ncbi:MAG: hypothetical protein KDD35_08270, partial [Bdellovibrionales bacterium]|nr:hypothetical protein [Bdellovibrionales bacterium]
EPPAFTMTNEEDSAGENSELSAKGEGEQAESVETESEETEEPQDPVKPLVAAETKRRRTNEDLEIPPPDKVSRPVIRKFPPSFPEWQNNFSKGTYDKLGIRIDNRLNLVDSIRVQLVNYVSEEDPESIGEIREVENGGLVASDYQYVYLQVKKSSARLGDKLLVFQNMGPLKQSTEFIEGGASSALTIEVQGIVSLTDIVQSQSSIPGYDLFRALVVKSVNPVGVGSQLRKGEIESVALNSQGDRSNVTAQLIGGPTSAKKQSFYPQSIAYLNRGSKDGLKPGQVLAIRSNRRSRFEGSIVKESFRPSGWLKIAKVTPHLATALVIKISEEISVGDYTGEASGVKSVSSSGTSIDDLSDQALDGFGSNSNEGSADEFGDLPTDDEGEMEEWDGLE